MERLLSVKQLVEQTGMSDKKVTEHMLRSGRAVNLGLGDQKRRLAIKESDWEAYMDSLCIAPPVSVALPPRRRESKAKADTAPAPGLMRRKEQRALGLYPPKK